MNRDFKGIWIPKKIWLDKNLKWVEKLLFVEIHSLDNVNGCFASNTYFAKFFQISSGRISQIIQSLIKKQYIVAEYIREGKEIKKRILRILEQNANKITEGYIENDDRYIENDEGGYIENDEDNNTKNNNTSNNTTIVTSIFNTEEKKDDILLSVYINDKQDNLKKEEEQRKEEEKNFEIVGEAAKMRPSNMRGGRV